MKEQNPKLIYAKDIWKNRDNKYSLKEFVSIKDYTQLVFERDKWKEELKQCDKERITWKKLCDEFTQHSVLKSDVEKLRNDILFFIAGKSNKRFYEKIRESFDSILQKNKEG